VPVPGTKPPPARLTPAGVRARARAGTWRGTTRGAAPGYVQCNVTILPADQAHDFLRWCERNRTVAPVLARSQPGDPRLPELGNIDLRYDLPSYRVFTDGCPQGEVGDLADVWADDLVGFAFGCSFSLEDGLRRAGVSLDYEERGFGGAIYETNRVTESAGAFGGPLIVSMRPLRAAETQRAWEVSERYPLLHGAPIHVGDPAALGVDLSRPLDALGKVDVAGGEVPVFWACGVTAHHAVMHARPSRAYTHVSGRMLVTDLTI
jgi:uncharacterized protein YcsI (UPF0317 family)